MYLEVDKRWLFNLTGISQLNVCHFHSSLLSRSVKVFFQLHKVREGPLTQPAMQSEYIVGIVDTAFGCLGNINMCHVHFGKSSRQIAASEPPPPKIPISVIKRCCRWIHLSRLSAGAVKEVQGMKVSGLKTVSVCQTGGGDRNSHMSVQERISGGNQSNAQTGTCRYAHKKTYKPVKTR